MRGGNAPRSSLSRAGSCCTTQNIGMPSWGWCENQSSDTRILMWYHHCALHAESLGLSMGEAGSPLLFGSMMMHTPDFDKVKACGKMPIILSCQNLRVSFILVQVLLHFIDLAVSWDRNVLPHNRENKALSHAMWTYTVPPNSPYRMAADQMRSIIANVEKKEKADIGNGGQSLSSQDITIIKWHHKVLPVCVNSFCWHRNLSLDKL